MRNVMLTCLIVVLGLAAVASAVDYTGNQRLEDFDSGQSDPWSSVGSPGWGFSSSTYAGGTANEAGGVMDYTSGTFPMYYADDNLGGVLTETDQFSASGTAYMSCDAPAFGYFEKSATNGSWPVLETMTGLQAVNTASPDSAYVVLHVDGVKVDETDIKSWLSQSVVYWRFSYDGAGGITADVADNASFTGNSVSLSGSATVDFDLDAFGLPRSRDHTTNRGELYIDNLSYSYVPEPATVAILGLGSLVLLRRRR
jgi:hypothetical protein